jgi:Carboxypeptidase regulatory-like domain
MWTLMIPVLAAALLAQPADSVTVSGVVVDAAGKPVSGVEVVLAGPRRTDRSILTLARAMTDAQGSFRLVVDPKRLMEVRPARAIWAYTPGRTVGVQQIELAGTGVLPPVRLTLAAPFKRTVTTLDPDGRPIAGVRVVPVDSGSNGRGMFVTPDDWRERLTVATGADGVATLSYFSATVDPMDVRVTAPGIVPHVFPLPNRPGNDRITLKVGRPARLAGSVSNASGQPVANLPVEVAVEILDYRRSNPNEDPKPTGMGPLIHFDSGPIRTGADGSFQTPLQLMTGWSYRISIRGEGAPIVGSDWLTAKTEVTTVPPLRLPFQQRRKLIGLVHDHQGQPVAGARVFLPSGEPATTTNAEGRFLLEGILPAKTYILVQAEGFRLQGWPGVPAQEPQERTITLTRLSESPDRALASLPAPIPMEESRALARRVLEPYLQAALEKGDDNSRFSCLSLLSRIDLTRALDLLGKHPFQDPSWEAGLQIAIATELLATDPVEAESIVAAIANRGDRVFGYAELVAALPAAERDRKRKILERATVQVHAPPDAGHGTDPRPRLRELARVAGGWLDIGEVEKARPLIREGWEITAALPKEQRYERSFLAAAAGFETDRAVALIRDISRPRLRRDYSMEVAESLASAHPAEAERVFQLVDDSSEASAYNRKDTIALRLCTRMAKTDPERARRLIAGLKNPREQACGWALLAFVLADRNMPAARSALAESIRLIDRLGGPPSRAELATPIVSVAINPAASILPIVEKVAPERLEEVFWKAVALMPKYDAQSGIFLARYDRQVADVFVTQVVTDLSRYRAGQYLLTWVRAKASVDPQGAVAMIEALPPARFDRRDAANVFMNQAREELVACLVEPIDEHWKAIWRHSSVPVDGRRFP